MGLLSIGTQFAAVNSNDNAKVNNNDPSEPSLNTTGMAFVANNDPSKTIFQQQTTTMRASNTFINLISNTSSTDLFSSSNSIVSTAAPLVSDLENKNAKVNGDEKEKEDSEGKEENKYSLDYLC